jgi:hypothetical protein
LQSRRKPDVDARDKRGHDGERSFDRIEIRSKVYDTLRFNLKHVQSEAPSSRDFDFPPWGECEVQKIVVRTNVGG